jgi:toxin ParE1/3/4
MGGLWESTNPALAGLRAWPIPRFQNCVIYYRPIRDGIEVVRVLHGAQDVERILEG